MPTLRTVTLGCKVNQYETQYVRQGLARLGYRDPAEGESADLCIVNTCTVTAESDSKCRKAIRALARQNPNARIIVMGCYAARAPAQVADLPGVVEVVTDKRRLPDLLARLGLAPAPAGISSCAWAVRAWVKVQDGCAMGCAYCIVPHGRPRLESRDPADVLDEVRRLVAGGYREIVLTGIHLGHYGADPASQDHCPGLDLASLVQRVLLLEGEFRIRLSSIEAAEVTPRLLRLMRDHPQRFCPHLHLPLQSGSDAVLARMRRRYTRRRFVQQCYVAREQVPDLVITTDAMVGFPGESEADFEATCRVVEEMGFAKVHVFRFSPRPGTPAADMSDQVPEHVKRRRAEQLGSLGQQVRARVLERFLGRRLRVLIESPLHGDNALMLGTSQNYLPVEVAGPGIMPGQFHPLVGCRIVNGRLHAVA